MRFEAHAYQERAVRWVVDHPRCALFLDMGLGKTVSTLTALVRLIDEAEISRVLVVAPKKVAESTWATEAAKWDHTRGLRVVAVAGDAERRRRAMAEEADVYVASRDNVQWLVDNYRRGSFDCIVVDELTSFKNHQAKRFKALRKWTAAARRVVGLTGTPVPNSMLDLWAQIHVIDNGERLGKFVGKYREQYFTAVPIGNFATKYAIRPGAEAAILERIGDICLTMRAGDYLSLPGLSEVTEYVELPEATMRRYRQFEREQVAVFAEQGATVIADSAAAMMSKLGQWANGAVYDGERNVVEVHDEKIERLAELVEAAQSPVLVFYQYRHDLSRILAKIRGAREYRGDDDLREWNDGGIGVLVAHPASAAYGLNMQRGGHYIVWFGLGFNLEQYQQANARLHRQGQTRPVTAYRLLARGTVDELAGAAIDRKAGLQEGVITALKEILKNYGDGR
ncbi:MAG: DEAD/DEAH box helicase [Bacteroidales bacterium]|nr:DEAD/DEAH box helicase [Bacteroidales bacterium]